MPAVWGRCRNTELTPKSMLHNLADCPLPHSVQTAKNMKWTKKYMARAHNRTLDSTGTTKHVVFSGHDAEVNIIQQGTPIDRLLSTQFWPTKLSWGYGTATRSQSYHARGRTPTGKAVDRTAPPPPAPADCAVPIVQGGCEDGTETDVSGGCVIWPIILIFMVEFQR